MVNVEIQREDASSMWNAIRKMIAVRKVHKVFGWGEFEWVDFDIKAIVAYKRSYNGEKILVIQNLDKKAYDVTIDHDVIDLITDKRISRDSLSIEPFQYLWLLITN